MLTDQLAAEFSVYRFKLQVVPFAVLHGYYARGEKYFSRNCTRNVPEFIDTFEYSERNEVARARYGKLHPTRRFRPVRKTDPQNMGTEKNHRQRYQSARSGEHYRFDKRLRFGLQAPRRRWRWIFVHSCQRSRGRCPYPQDIDRKPAERKSPVC